MSAKAYKLFSECKTPVQVVIILNITEAEVTELYREYWKLGLDKLNTIYKETNGKYATIGETRRGKDCHFNCCQ